MSTTGTCFSTAPSDELGLSNVISVSQQTGIPAPSLISSTIRPQILHLKTLIIPPFLVLF